jgi:hypothetical protein
MARIGGGVGVSGEGTMTVQVKTALALKEWAAVIDAIERGLQLVTLRKGGIREKAFLVEGRSFYLLPTFEHQAPELIKPEFRGSLERALADQRDDSGLIVHARADVAGLWEIDDQRRLAALAPYHMFTDEYARSRFNWRPKQPLTVLLLRAYRLEQPWHTGLPSGVGGCRSWLEVDANTAPADIGPVLADAEFEAHLTALRAALD